MTYKNLEIVALNHDISEYELKEGDTGTIVDVYESGEAYEVEFVSSYGETIALLTLDPSDLRPLKSNTFLIWNEPSWRGLEQSRIYSAINSHEAGTQQYFSQL